MTTVPRHEAEGSTTKVEVITSPEAIGAIVVMLVLCLGPLATGMPWLGLLITCGIGLGLLFGALISGNNALAGFSICFAGVLGTLIWGALEVTWLLLVPVVVLVLILSDLLRVAAVRRRAAVVSDQLLLGPVLGSMAAGAVALVSAGLVRVIGNAGSGGSWLWTPVAIGLFMVFTIVLLIVPRRGATDADKRRWTAGEPIPPRPRRY